MASLAYLKKQKFKTAREHDYVFDNLFVVSGEKDFNKAARKAAMATAQPIIIPVYESMFSELQHYSSHEIGWHANPRLPDHVDCSYDGRSLNSTTSPAFVTGKDRYRYFATPKVSSQPTTVAIAPEEVDLELEITKNVRKETSRTADKAVQTIYRESSAQTKPYEPDYVISEKCRQTPEVLKLEDIKIDPEGGIKLEIVEKLKRLRLKRAWLAKGSNIEILRMIEENEQKYRELELDREMKNSRDLTLKTNVNTNRPRNIWTAAKDRIKKCASALEHKREREIRKIEAKRDNFNKQIEQLVHRKNAPTLPSTINRKALTMKLNTKFTPKYDDMKRQTADLGQKMKAKIDGCSRKHRMHRKNVLQFEEQLLLEQGKTVSNINKSLDFSYDPFNEENLDNIVSGLIESVIESIKNDNEDDSEESD